jgi:hypothetical protein
MPPAMVKPEHETYWDRAKQRAEEEGHAGDYAYIVGIFKRMTMNKSLQKAFTTPPTFRRAVHPVGTPNREEYRLMQEVKKTPPQFTIDRFLETPILSVEGIPKNLGLSQDQEENLVGVLGRVMQSANAIAFRQALFHELEGYQPDIKAAVFQKAFSFWKARLAKSVGCEVYSPDELRKAEARGGSYYRRVPTKKGGYRYYYDQGKYDGSKDAHTSGSDARTGYLKKRVMHTIEQAGDKGCDVESFKALAKRYGVKEVAGVVKGCVDGKELSFKKGRFYRGGGTEK